MLPRFLSRAVRLTCLFFAVCIPLLFATSVPTMFVVEAAPSSTNWCVAGGFQGWNENSTPLYDDGTNGDLIPGDGVFSRDVEISTADRYEFKVVECGNWGNAFPANNAWLNSSADNQTVKITFDTNDHSADAGPTLYPTQNIVNVTNDALPASFTAVGDFQGWSNDNSATLMTSIGDGLHYLAYAVPSAGSYIGKITTTGSWDAFGPDGRNKDAGNFSFTTDSDNQDVIFLLDTNTGRATVTTHGTPGSGNYCLAGDFQAGWNNASLPMYDDGTNGDLISGDGIYSLDFTIADAGRNEFKVFACGDWGTGYPGDNAWVITSSANQTVKFTFDTNDHSSDAGLMLYPTQYIVDATGDDFPTSFTAVGSWQGFDPSDVATVMSDLGRNQHLYVATLSAGTNVETKVTNDGWSNQVGTDGRNKNAPGHKVDIPTDGTQAYIYLDGNQSRFGVKLLEPAGLPTDTTLVAAPVHYSTQQEVFYFVLPDRFANGDPSNDSGGSASGDPTEHGFDPTGRAFFHGGDFAGLESQLDYLDGLGITALWITPPYLNQTIQPDGSEPGGLGAAYHGYWILDFEQTDPHLGTSAELISLITAAHAKGMKVFFDFVVNHTADVITYEEGTSSYRDKATYPYRDDTGAPFDDRLVAGDEANFPPLNSDSFPYTPQIPAGKETLKAPAFLNDPLNYHNRGDSTFSGESSEYGDFFGLDDLFTEKPEVVDGYIDIAKNLIDTYNIDGFRLDTVKHVNIEFWQAFVPAVMAHGGSDFYMYGEVFDGNPSFLSQYTTAGKLPSVVDFGLHGAAVNFASASGATNNLRNFFDNDDYYTDADSSAYGLGNFVSNHDGGIERFGSKLLANNPGASDDELVSRMELAHGLIYFARGFPIVYYGDEQGFVGGGSDKAAREDMMPGQVAAYNANDHIGSNATPADDNFDVTHPLYATLSDLAAVRAAHPAFQVGSQVHRYSEGGSGIYAFSRFTQQSDLRSAEMALGNEYLVVLNNSEADASATVPTSSPDTTFNLIYSNVPTDRAISADSNSNGDLALVNVPPLSVNVYVAAAPMACGDAAPAVTISVPETLSDRAQISATLSENVVAEITFAVSSDGGANYTVIGTDTNAPYRVFYDVSGYAPETTLTFQAVVNDLCGNAATADAAQGTTDVEEAAASERPKYALIHYNRPDGQYGDFDSADFNDFWGLHLWGDPFDIAANQVKGNDLSWTNPMPFYGQDDYGQFAWIKLSESADLGSEIGFIVHKADAKDPDGDRFFNPYTTPEIWLRSGDATIYTNKAEAMGGVTIHYNRSGDDYDGWGLHLWQDGWNTDWNNPFPATGDDDYGKVYEITKAALDAHLGGDIPLDLSQPINFIMHKGDDKNCPDDQSLTPTGSLATIWLAEGECDYATSRGEATNTAIIHYRRPAGDYGNYASGDYNDFWGLHTWGDADDPGWTTPRKPVDTDTFGIVFEVPLNTDSPTEIGYILHRGDEKDPGPDQFLNFAANGFEVWQVQGADPECPYVAPVGGGAAGAPDLSKARAHWIDEYNIVWPDATDATYTYELAYALNGGMTIDVNGVAGGATLPLTPNGIYVSADNRGKFPHLDGMPQFRITAANGRTPAGDLLKGQLAVIGSKDGQTNLGTGVQIPGVLDDLYTSNQTLGVSWDSDAPTLRVWAPTAKSVTLHLFADSAEATLSMTHTMTFEGSDGTWSIAGDAGWKDLFYLYEVEVYVHSTGNVEHNLVTDPYSFSLSTNSKRSQIVDLNDAALKPAGWDAMHKPKLDNPEQISVYELHVRDFSIFDETVPMGDRGTFAAFTHANSNGMQHLARLAEDGLTHLHLLPVFDIATIEEDASMRQEPDYGILASHAVTSTEQQAAIAAIDDQDGFNWGYDPYHYTTPEGSYSTNPDGSQRILEFRQMVQSLNDAGLLVVMDVVYNHTSHAGQDDQSVLDRVVPGYYHRLNADGAIETSTCCQNTASEHAMMEKLMIDSLLTWAEMYKIDSFRFDLMGHHMKSNMLNVQAALSALTPEAHGVDGSQIYLYGEGWNFGEVANNARGVNATQTNMAGTGIGTFSDRLRDAVRGPGPFDGGNDLKKQGWISGQFYDPNSHPGANDLGRLMLQGDQIRVGLAGNLANYQFVDRTGATVMGSQVDYNGSPTGYTADPQENVSYVSKHDNQTLYDINAYTLPDGTTMADRARVQNLGLSIVAFGQGTNFFHVGSDMLRSKSMDRDSYNSGDWFNRLDFTYQSNNFGVGLPVAEKNQDNWPIMEPILANPTNMPTQADIEFNHAVFQEYLAIRSGSPLFSLPTLDEVQARLAFHNTGADQTPGVIVMSLEDREGVRSIDPLYDRIVVIFNANDEAQTITNTLWISDELELHPIQQASVDATVQTASFDAESGVFSVPARTTAVFVIDQAPFYAFLPMVMVPPSDAPDLVVEAVSVSSAGVNVMIRNVGNVATDDSFWVDFYINPSTPPTGPNQTFVTAGGTGFTWFYSGVLQPGASATLRLNGPYHLVGQGWNGGTLTAGTQIYVQVDSADISTSYGAVHEQHEIDGGAYNNIAMQTLDSTVIVPSSRSGTSGVAVEAPVRPK